jgi:hypothetical protein
MRRIVLSTTLLMLLLTPAVASAKLPFFSLEAYPIRPDVGEPITLTMTCYEDMAHTRPWSACLGAGGRMAWVHPLDTEGELHRDDWIEVVGEATASGSTQGHVVLNEPGAYDVLPLWRGWGFDHSPGFPDPVRIEVDHGAPILSIAAVGAGVVGVWLAVAVKRRRVASVINR